MAKPISLQREYDDLLRDIAGCRHPVSPDNRRSYGAALARLAACRQQVVDFQRRYPHLAVDKAATLKNVLKEITRQGRRVETLREAAGIPKPQPQKIITVWDLLPDKRKKPVTDSSRSRSR